MPAPAVELSPAFKQEIYDTLRSDTLRLEHLLERDLSHWLGGIRPQDRTLNKAA